MKNRVWEFLFGQESGSEEFDAFKRETENSSYRQKFANLFSHPTFCHGETVIDYDKCVFFKKENIRFMLQVALILMFLAILIIIMRYAKAWFDEIRNKLVFNFMSRGARANVNTLLQVVNDL